MNMRTMRAVLLGAGALAMSALAGNAGAVTIDFSGSGTGGAIGNTYAALGLTFSGGTFAQCGGGCPSPTPNGFFDLLGQSGSSTAFFSTAQSAISFQNVSYSSFTATAYNAANVVVDTVSDSQGYPISNAIDWLTGAGITKVVFAVSGNPYTDAGITNLTFTAGAAPAPEPATWAMMGLGFAALGFAGYRARRSAAVAA